MTNQEFSDTFTTLLNSYNTQAQFGEQASKREIVLDEYEKSVLLTQAQDIIVKSYFDGSSNQQGQGFDDSARRQVDFSSLVKVARLAKDEGEYETFDDRGLVYKMPRKSTDVNSTDVNSTDVLFILNESLIKQTLGDDGTVIKSENFVIVPINYKEYDREMSKPYAQPLKKQAWRLFQNNATGFDVNSELIPRWNIKEEENKVSFVYKIRYVKRPNPIILEDLPNGLVIDGISTETACELNPILHLDVLNKAVEIAIATRGGGSYQTAVGTALNSSPNK